MGRRVQIVLFLTAFSAVGVYLIGPVATAHHLWSVPHHWCAEHEAFEHTCSGDCGDVAIALSLIPGLTKGSPSGGGEHVHQVCHQLTQTRREVQDSHEAEAFHGATVATEERRSLELTLLPRRSTIDVAPKQSPPSAA